MKIEWTERAEGEYDQIGEYIYTKWGRKSVEKFILKVDEKIQSLVSNPNFCQLKDKKINIRRCVIHPKVSMYYKVEENRIVILSMFSNAMDPRKRDFLE